MGHQFDPQVKHFVLACFDSTMMADCIDDAKLEYEDGNKDPDIEKPDEFSHRKWVSWQEMVYIYFNAMKNIQGLPLAYVIRKTPAPSGIFVDREQEIIQNDPLQGNMFSHENKKVLAIIKQLTVDTYAETWMKGKGCGREAMMALKNHYYGKSQGERRKQMAKDDIKRLFYRNETTFYFQKYVTKMRQTFNVLYNYNVPLYEEDKARQLLHNINIPKTV